jgi:VIT family protein
MEVSETRTTSHSEPAWRRICGGWMPNTTRRGTECHRHRTSRRTSLRRRRSETLVIGMSDGLTVPFALAAALSGVVESTGVVITAGLAVRQGHIHRQEAAPQRLADGSRRRAGGRRRLWDCEADRVRNSYRCTTPGGTFMATHSKTNHAVQRLRRLARRRHEAELKKSRGGGTDKRSPAQS